MDIVGREWALSPTALSGTKKNDWPFWFDLGLRFLEVLTKLVKVGISIPLLARWESQMPSPMKSSCESNEMSSVVRDLVFLEGVAVAWWEFLCEGFWIGTKLMFSLLLFACLTLPPYI